MNDVNRGEDYQEPSKLKLTPADKRPPVPAPSVLHDSVESAENERKRRGMEVHIIFKDATAEKIMKNVDNVYTKGEMLVIRQGDWLWKYPLMNIFSVCHKHGKHWGSKAHKKEEKLEP